MAPGAAPFPLRSGLLDISSEALVVDRLIERARGIDLVSAERRDSACGDYDKYL
jgi:hypothetical protein